MAATVINLLRLCATSESERSLYFIWLLLDPKSICSTSAPESLKLCSSIYWDWHILEKIFFKCCNVRLLAVGKLQWNSPITILFRRTRQKSHLLRAFEFDYIRRLKHAARSMFWDFSGNQDFKLLGLFTGVWKFPDSEWTSSKSRVSHFFTKVSNAVTHQPIELESCSNQLRIQQVF